MRLAPRDRERSSSSDRSERSPARSARVAEERASVVVAVRHHESADHSASRRPNWYSTRVGRAALGLEGEVEGLRKVLSELCDVPACSALLSCIIASHEYVRRAPANFSASVFCPGDDRHGDVPFHEVAIDPQASCALPPPPRRG